MNTMTMMTRATASMTLDDWVLIKELAQPDLVERFKALV